MPVKQAVAGHTAGQVMLLYEGGAWVPKMAQRRALERLRHDGPAPGAFVTAAYPAALQSLDSARRFAHTAGLPFRDGAPAGGRGRSARRAGPGLKLGLLLRLVSSARRSRPPEVRLYMLIGAQVVRWLLSNRRPEFGTDDVRVRVPRTTEPRAVRRYVEEWLAGLQRGGDDASRGILEAAQEHPRAVTGAARWRGY